MRPLLYAESAPAPALAAHVLSHWRFEARLAPGETMEHHVWPDGCVSLLVAVRGGAGTPLLAGPTVEARRLPVEGGLRCDGVRLWPDAAAAVLGVPPEPLRGRSVPAAPLFGRTVLVLAEAVAAAEDAAAAAAAFERWIGERLAVAPPLDAKVRHAVLAIVASRGATPVGRLAEGVALSRRQLERRFRRAVGLTPKEFARVRRVRSAIAAALDAEWSWCRIASEFGFADQPHLVREVSGVTGLTPVALGVRLGMIEHRTVTP